MRMDSKPEPAPKPKFDYDLVASFQWALSRVRDPDYLQAVGFYALAIQIPAILLTVASLFLGVADVSSVPGSGLSLPLLLAAAGGLALAVLASLALGLHLYPRVLRKAMALAAVPIAPKPPGFVEWLVFSIRLGLVNLSCLYDPKLLIPAALFLVPAVLFSILFFGALTGLASGLGQAASNALLLGAPAFHPAASALRPLAAAASAGAASLQAESLLRLALVGLPALVSAVFFILSWSLASAIHNVRTSFAPLLLLRGDGPEGEMPRRSHSLVQGHTLEVGLVYVVASILLGLAAFIPSLAFSLLGMLPVVGSLFEVVGNLLITWLSMAFFVLVQVDLFRRFDGQFGPSAPAGGARPASARPVKHRTPPIAPKPRA